MKLVGYSKDQKKNSFQEPIYGDSKGVRYSHCIDNRHNITGFEIAKINPADFEKIYLSTKFSVGSKAAIVFVGKENYLHYQSAPHAIEEIIHYLNDHSETDSINGILDQAMLLKNRIFSDHFVVDNFVVKMDPDEEGIILSFDFPAPKRENSATDQSAENKKTITITENSAAKKNSDEAIFSNAMKQLNSVDMNFELKLKLRAEERRSKLKTFNYQFKLNQNTARRKKTTD
jgi:hypothetical protein